MIRFLAAFFSVYGLVHAFFYFRVKVLLPDKWQAHAVLILFLSVMTFARAVAHLLERAGHVTAATVWAAVAFGWMGFLFIAFWCLLLAGAAGMLFMGLNALAGWDLPRLTGRAPTLVVLGIVLLINIYGFFEARSIRVERITISTSKLPAGVDRIRIAQITDVHLGLMAGEDLVARIMEKVRPENPDILVSTGDLIDGDMTHGKGVPPYFRDLTPRLGKYAITGNHEIYAGVQQSISATEEFGFRVLGGEIIQAGGISIVGVDDPARGTPLDETKLLLGAERGDFTVLLKHRPEVSPGSAGLFDLQLSGHTHRGQVFPFRYFSERYYPMQNGLYRLDNGSLLYTSRGTGTWGPPIRVLAPPEVTIIDIVRE